MNNEDQFIGYLINVGVTTCRLFGVREDESLKELSVNSYGILPENEGYFVEIINQINERIVKTINSDAFLIKVIVDSKFADLFESEIELKEFIREFYVQTNLYFNILTQDQTERNLEKLFGEIKEDTAIINIGRNYIDIMTIKNRNVDSISLKYSLRELDVFLLNKKYPEKLTEADIDKIKAKISKEIKKSIKNVSVTKAIIIKNELSFMKQFEYPLTPNNDTEIRDHEFEIDFEEYKKANREKLFCIDLGKKLSEMNIDKSDRDRLYGFKSGHLLLETIFEIINVKKIVPSDLLNIHGSINSYIYKVVLSGSTNEKRADYFFEAAKFIKKLGASILSPNFEGDKLTPITTASDYRHLRAIDDCDILFICNKDGYIGESTACEIYYASALRKTIVFWAEPDKDDSKRLYCIPHEHWNNIKIIGVHENER